MITKTSSAFLLCLFLSLAASCSNTPDDQPKLGTVSGKVTLDGAPLAGAFVRYYPTTGRASGGVTDEEGNYELVFIRDEMGAVLGKHVVRITTRNEDDDPFGTQGSEKVPARYNKESTLEVTVEEGDNTFDFDLESK